MSPFMSEKPALTIIDVSRQILLSQSYQAICLLVSVAIPLRRLGALFPGI